MPPSELKQLGRNGDGSLLWHCWGWVSEQILNGTSAQIRCTVPFTSVYAGKSGQKTNQKQTLLKLSTTQKKQTTQNTAKQNYPGSVAFYNTRPGNEVHFANAFVAVFWSQWTASSSASWRASSPPANFVCGQSSMMCVIVCRCPHWHRSDWAMPQRWRLAWQVPWPVRNRFRRVHGWRGRSKPGGRMAGSGTRPWLTTEG